MIYAFFHQALVEQPMSGSHIMGCKSIVITAGHTLEEFVIASFASCIELIQSYLLRI